MSRAAMHDKATVLRQMISQIMEEPGNRIRNLAIASEAIEYLENNFPCVARPANATNADCAELSAGRKGEQEAPHGED